MISEWLYGFPVTSTVLLFGLGGGALLAAAPVLREKLFRVKTSREYSSVARNTLTVIIGVMGTLLAFSLVQADANLRQIQKDVGAEAHDLAQIGGNVNSAAATSRPSRSSAFFKISV